MNRALLQRLTDELNYERERANRSRPTRHWLKLARDLYAAGMYHSASIAFKRVMYGCEHYCQTL